MKNRDIFGRKTASLPPLADIRWCRVALQKAAAARSFLIVFQAKTTYPSYQSASCRQSVPIRV
jgi:hypothetical protein